LDAVRHWTQVFKGIQEHMSEI